MTTLITKKTYYLIHNALNDPNLATKVLQNYPSTTIIASQYNQIISQKTKTLIKPTFQIYNNNNILNIEITKTLKNIITINTNMITKLKFGNNTQSLLITHKLTKIRHLNIKIKTESTTFTNLSDINNLIITYTNPLNRNHQINLHLTKKKTLPTIQNEITQVTKKINTTKITIELSHSLNVPLPITTNIYKLLYENQPIQKILTNLITNQTIYKINRPIALST